LDWAETVIEVIEIFDLQSLISKEKILWTEHVALKMRERNLKRVDVISCIQNGEIIEQYLDDIPFPSCLVFGISSSGKPLHVVCGLNPGVCCYIITVYNPDPGKWLSDCKTRKAAV
jgi:hypothetical protein